MSKIRVMSENLANKIAAGEVVEKCASVVKELVENAIDAGATVIKVNLTNGGLTGINVIDNGSGMDEHDATLAFSRHATSKIYKDDDLFFIETLGFRGEALASIASVSEVDLKTSMGEVGTHVHIKGGVIELKENYHARKGSEITVTNLFYNTPARLKYLKTENTELNHSLWFIERLALSKTEINFSLSNNDHLLVKTSGSNNLLKAIHEIYGLNVSSNMLEISNSNDDFQIKGFIAKPAVLKKNRNHFNTFINGRIIRNIEINKAINDAYNTYKHEGFYPIVVINIYTDPTLVDVNIHPTKQDVKMSKMTDLTDLLYSTIKTTLYNNLLVPESSMLEKKDEVKKEDNIVNNEVKRTEIVQTSMDLDNSNNILKKTKNEEFKLLKLNPIGQIKKTYIIAEALDGMYIIDQHAAHERVNYEMITKRFRDEEVMITDMLVPISFELSASEYTLLKERINILEDLGFKIEDFGINTIILKSHPTWLKTNYEKNGLREIIDLVLLDKNFKKERFLDSLAKMTSCKMSVKAGDHLSIEEMQKLLDDLKDCDNPYNCCHGRPSIIRYTGKTLEKIFKRVI